MSDAPQPSEPESLAEITSAVAATQAALVESLQDELVCAVCGCVFIDPRVLQCQHCFCLRCLYSTVSRDRMPQLEVPCAYRCEGATVTKGDIRTLPKNHYLTNTCILLRQHLVRRARLLEKKMALRAEKASEEVLLPSSSPSSHEADACDAAAAETASPASSVAAALLLKTERELVAELSECEWCSCTTPSCEVCPYCWSRVCAECRGQFSDHQFLCVEPHEPGRRPAAGWLPGSTSSVVAALTQPSTEEAAGAPLPPRQSLADLRSSADLPAATHDATYPFLITPCFVSTLVKEYVVKQHHSPLHVSEIDVTDITPVRLCVPEYTVQCQHQTTGFSFDYTVHPIFSIEEKLMVDINLPHWTEGDGKASSTLSFLANATRLGETVLQDLRMLSKATSDVVMELSSAAHQASVRRNKGFHMFALHVWSLARAQCQVAREALLPHLERSRLLENIMGDLVTYRYQQTVTRAAAPHKHVIRDQCTGFLKAELQLTRQLDQVMESIDAACRGIYALLGRMREAMQELAQPKTHRGEEHKKTRHSRLRFSVPLFKGTGEDQKQQQEHSSTHEAARAYTRPTRAAAARRSVTGSTTTTTTAMEVPDPVLMEDAVSEVSFRGQVSEHHHTAQVLTDSLISILRCFMQARLWEWSMGNTCIRECGLGEEDRRELLAAEETLQLLTDKLIKRIWSCARLVYILEVQQDEAGPGSSLDILVDTETFVLLDQGMENPVYDHGEVFEGLKALSQLRNRLLSMSSSSALASRTPELQQELLSMMSSVLKTTMEHQVTVLRSVTVAEHDYERSLASYLRTRQMSPDVGEAPPMGEGTLLAADVLKAMQHGSSWHQLAGESNGPPMREKDDVQCSNDRPAHPSSASPASALGLQGAAVAGSSDALMLAELLESRHTPYALVTDFSRRDTALISCQHYGEALVRVANGQSLGEGGSVFQAATTAESEAAVSALHRLPPLPDRHEVVGLSASATAAPPAVDGIADAGGIGGGAENASSPEGTVVSLQDAVPVEDTTVPVTELHETSLPSSGAVGPAPNPVHAELLFEADCTDCSVETAQVTPTPADEEGCRKAALLFKTTFQLPATARSVLRRRMTYLPFYRGQCSYKGSSTTFYVDAQTGAVSVNAMALSVGGGRQYVLEMLSSPFFFIVFNSTLSLLLHKRYKVELLYK